MLIAGLISLLFSWFVILVLIEAIRNKDIKILQIGMCFLAPIVIQTGMAITGIVEILSALKEKSKWIRNAVFAQALIIDRKMEHNPYAEYREEVFQCELIIEIPRTKTIVMDVDDKIYDRYPRQDYLKVFFYNDDPLVILIDIK